MSDSLFEKHQELLEEALEAYLDAQFYLDQPGVFARTGTEESPYGLPLNISYPQCSPDALINAASMEIALLIDERNSLVAREAALQPDVRIIDYTGGTAFGECLPEQQRVCGRALLLRPETVAHLRCL